MELSPEANRKRGQIKVISGWRGVGKTTYCRKEIERLQNAGCRVAGLLSLARFTGEEKTGYWVCDVGSGEQRLLATSLPGEIEGIQLGPWIFDPQAIGWGNRVLERSSGAEVIIIDELGFLEFNRQAGFLSAFPLLETRDFDLALVVIRPECLAEFTRRGFSFEVVEIPDPHNPPDSGTA